MAFFILLVMFFVTWDFITKTEKLVKKSMSDTCNTLTAVEATLVDTKEEVVLIGGTVGGLGDSLSSLSDGLDQAG